VTPGDPKASVSAAVLLLAVAVVVVTVASSAQGAAAAAVPRCRADELRLTDGAYGEAALQFTQTLTFTDRARASCWLAGWPRLSVPGRSRPVKTVRVVQGASGSRPFTRVLLTASGAASFDLYGADWDASANRPCPQTAALLVAPPGTQTALRVRVRVPDCGRFYVAPLVAGRRDRAAWSLVWRG